MLEMKKIPKKIIKKLMDKKIKLLPQMR